MDEDGKPDLPDYEITEIGPLTVERNGRVISIKSSLGPQHRTDIEQKMRILNPKIKKEIDEKIKILITLIETCDPTDFLFSESWANCLYDPKDTESTREGLEAYAEYALSLALTKPFDRERLHPTKDQLEDFSKTVISIFDKIGFYFTTERAEMKENRELHIFRYFSIMTSLYLRGDSTEQHHLDLVRGLFEPHNDFFIRSFGYDIKQIIDYISEIFRQVNNNVNTQIQILSKIADLHRLYCEYAEQLENRSKSDEKLSKEFFSIEANKQKKDQLHSQQSDLSTDIFEITPNEILPVCFLDRISTQFGRNYQFVEETKYCGWPTNTTIISKFPIITHNNRYYCYVPQLIFRNIIGILEGWIQNTDPTYYQNKYQKQKGEYLERKSLEYISKILPNSKVYGKLFYKISEEGKIKNAETDGLIIYDNNLFIIEAKAGLYHPSARRGSIEKIIGDVDKLIAGAYSQALRTKDYIFNSKNPVFKDKTGRIVFDAKDTSKFQNVFLVNTTLENLSYLSTSLNSLRYFGIIDGREWLWSVYINDLRTISDLIDTPSIFLQYLKRRIRANDFPQFSATDELDFLMVFFEEGLYFEDGHLDKIGSYKPIGYTDAIEKYYNYLAGLIPDAEKPSLKISQEFKDLIIQIENTGKYGFSQVTTTLLDYNFTTQQKLLNCIDTLKQLSTQDKKYHDATFISDDLKTGLTLIVDTNNSPVPSKYKSYLKSKKYQTHTNTWIILILKVSENLIRTIDFEINNTPWKYSFEMEKSVKTHLLSQKGAHPDSGKKFQRNEMCPCGSGKKFKKCCGKGYHKGSRL